MADLTSTLPQQVELGAQRRLDYRTISVMTDSGFEVRNSKWSEPLRIYEISYPTARDDDPVYTAVVELYAEALGMAKSFNFHDWIDGTVVTVRFDSPLEIDSPMKGLNHIVSMVLKEVRE